MSCLRTCLSIEKDGEAAARFYTGLLPDSEIGTIRRPTAQAPPVLIEFTLAGAAYSLLVSKGGPSPNAAVSLAMTLPQTEADRLYDRILSAGGQELQCGWVTDPWGISWQIVPEGFLSALFGSDAEANSRAHDAMLAMKRLSVASIETARKGH